MAKSSAKVITIKCETIVGESREKCGVAMLKIGETGLKCVNSGREGKLSYVGKRK